LIQGIGETAFFHEPRRPNVKLGNLEKPVNGIGRIMTKKILWKSASNAKRNPVNTLLHNGLRHFAASLHVPQVAHSARR
jgi:hypothetical protein